MLRNTEASPRVMCYNITTSQMATITIEQVVDVSVMGVGSALHTIIWHRYRTTIIVNNTDG